MGCDPFRIKPYIKRIMTSQQTDHDDQPDVQRGDMRLGPISPGDTPHFTRLFVTQSGVMNLILTGADSETPQFTVIVSVFSPSSKVPHVTLHGGPDKLSPVLGVAHLSHFGTNAIGIGDPQSDATSVIWETLSCASKWSHATYQYEFIFGEQGRTSFIWQREHNPFLDDQAPMYLYEEGKPDVVLARYECNGFWRWRKRGCFLIRDGFGDGWALMALLTGLSLLELSRRRAGQGRRL